MSNEELNKKRELLSKIVKELNISDTSRNFEQRIVAGRVTPTPSFSIKPPKIVIVDPKKDDEK